MTVTYQYTIIICWVSFCNRLCYTNQSMTCWKLIIWLVECFRYSDQQQKKRDSGIYDWFKAQLIWGAFLFPWSMSNIRFKKPCFGKIPAKTNDLIIYDCEKMLSSLWIVCRAKQLDKSVICYLGGGGTRRRSWSDLLGCIYSFISRGSNQLTSDPSTTHQSTTTVPQNNRDWSLICSGQTFQLN